VRNKLYQWPLIIGSVLGVVALIVAFSQPSSEPTRFNDAIWLAGSLAVFALLAFGTGLFLRLRHETGDPKKSGTRSRV
jgi:hypothetical protein